MDLSRIKEHVLGHYPGQAQDDVFPLGPISEVAPAFHVIEIDGEKGGVLYSTVGASLASEPLEFVMYAPDAAAGHLETMTAVGYWHLTKGLRLHDIVSIGRPWIDGTDLKHLLVSFPYPLGPQFEEGLDGLRFLWLLPIYDAEKLLAEAEGVEALERRFDERQINIYDPARPTVA